MTWIILKS